MAWNTGETLAAKLARADSKIGQVKTQTQFLRDKSAAGVTSYRELFDHMVLLDAAITEINDISGAVGLQGYVRDQKSDQTIDLSAEKTAFVNAATTLRDWLSTNLPTTAQGYLEEYTVSNFVRVNRTFNTGQTAGFRTEADALLAVIE